MNRRHAVYAVIVLSAGAGLAETAKAERPTPRCTDEMSALLLKHARKHGVPIDLLHRVVIRESRYNATARHSRYYGLMQITYATAKSMGYHGAPGGLLDADTNLTYAVPYLANAYMLSRGNDERAIRLYAAGYYATAKQQSMIADLRTADSPAVQAVKVVTAQVETPRNPVSRLFGLLTAPPAAETSVAPAAEATVSAAAETGVAEADAKSAAAAESRTEAAAKAKPSEIAQSGKAAVHHPGKTPATNPTPAVLTASTNGSAKFETTLRGAAAAVPADFTPAATAAARSDEKPAIGKVAAAAKPQAKPAKIATKAKPQPVETDVADATTDETVDAASADDLPAVKPTAPKKKAARAVRQIAAASAGDDPASRGTTQVAKRVEAKTKLAARAAHVQQAAAKAETAAE